MKYKKVVCDEYNIHIIKNENYHSINLSISFTQNVNKKLITYQNALVDILTYSSNKYNTNTKLIRKCQELYSLRPTAYTVRYGNLYCTNFGISILDSIYIKEDNLCDNILLLKEIILNPLIINNSFDEKILDFVKKQITNEVLNIREDPRSYCSIHMLELMDNKNNYALTGYSDISLLNKINGKSLYKYYLDMIHNSKIDIFLVGNIKNEESIIKLIKDNFKFNNRKYLLMDPYTYHDKKGMEKEYFEKMKYQQSKISIGFKFFNLTEFESKYVSSILNILLGGNNNALLMRYVREEKGLCYYIGSFISKLDNILIINSGFKKENYKEMLKTIKKIFDDIKKGLITDSDLEKAKIEMLENAQEYKENNYNLMKYYYGLEIFNSDDFLTKKKMINKVTKEDVINITKKINLETVFSIEGEYDKV